MRIYRLAMHLFAAIAFIPTCGAHDIRGLGDKSIAVSNELNVSALTKLANQQSDPGAKFVFSRLLLWTPGQTLKVCFFSGTDAEKDFVKQSVAELLDGKNVNIKIDFGTAYRDCSSSAGDLRISFSDGCCAAYVGRTSLQPSIKTKPSILLQGVTNLAPAVAKQTVMHEVIHALGFSHEHQSPESPCAFKKNEIMAAYGWNEDEYKVNLKQLEQNSRSYTWSSYDRTSIMKYYFDPAYLVGGDQSNCYSSDNLLPSTRDYDGLRLAYPAGATPVSVERTKAALDVIGASSVPAEVKALAKELRKLE